MHCIQYTMLFLLIYFLIFFFVNPRWNKGDVMWCDQTFLWITFHQKFWIFVRFTENTSKCSLWNCSKMGMSMSSSSDELWVKSEPKYPVLSVQRYFLKLLLTFSWYMINESSHTSAMTANIGEKQCHGWAHVCMFMKVFAFQTIKASFEK